MKRILFVCIANRCRSVIAEHLLRGMLLEADEKLAHEVEISSGGIFPRECVQCSKDHGIDITRPYYGKAPNQPVIAMLAEKGIDVSNYRSRGVNRPMLEQANLVITLLQVYKRGVLFLFPSGADRTFTFCEFTGTEGYFLYDDCQTAPHELKRRDLHDIPEMVNGLFAEIEQQLTQAMPKFLDFLRRKT